MADEDGFNYNRPNPRKEDILFGPDSTLWRMDADLEFIPGKDATYRDGYRRAGRILVEWVSKNGCQDFLVFPICHSYRHFVELALKRLIKSGCNLAEREMTKRESRLYAEEHNLSKLWHAYRSISGELERLSDDLKALKEDIEGIDSYIGQLHAIDAGSYSFRYPRGKDGAD